MYRFLILSYDSLIEPKWVSEKSPKIDLAVKHLKLYEYSGEPKFESLWVQVWHFMNTKLWVPEWVILLRFCLWCVTLLINTRFRFF